MHAFCTYVYTLISGAHMHTFLGCICLALVDPAKQFSRI